MDLQRPDASTFIRVRDVLFARVTTPANRQHLQAAIVWASQANTLPAAFWVLAHLLCDPPARAAVTAEVEAAGLGDLKALPKLTLEFELLAPGLPPLDKSRAGLGVLSPISEVRCRIRRRPGAGADGLPAPG